MYKNVLVAVALDHDAQYLPKGQLEDNVHELEEQLRNSLPDSDGIEVAVVFGHAGHTIVDWATHHDIDCVVVASHRPGVKDYFLGSTAARVVRHAPCAVHVHR